jgi:hypothetical protein
VKLLATKLAAGGKYDRLDFVRADGSVATVMQPRQRILPHDLLHYLVETRMGFVGGFIGLVNGGLDPAFAAQLTHDERQRLCSEEAVQAEAVVESLQAQLWTGSLDVEMFAYGAALAAERRGVAPPIISTAAAEQLFSEAVMLGERWNALAAGERLELQWPA